MARESSGDLNLVLSEEEAYEVLTRCVSHDGEDNPVFRSAIRKLAEAIKGDHQRAA